MILLRGQSGLVSGFVVECGGGVWLSFFLAECASILFMCLLFCIIFTGSDIYSLLFYFSLAFVSFLFVWILGTVRTFRCVKVNVFGLEEIFISFVKLSFIVFWC